MSESAHPHPILAFLDAVQQQVYHIEHIVNDLYDDSLEPKAAFEICHARSIFGRDLAPLHAKALKAVEPTTSVRVNQDDLARQLNELYVMHFKFLENWEASAQNWFNDRTRSDNSDFCEVVIFVHKIRVFLKYLVDVKAPGIANETPRADLVKPMLEDSRTGPPAPGEQAPDRSNLPMGVPVETGVSAPKSETPADSTATPAEQTDPVSRAIALMLAADKEGKPLNIIDLPAIVGCSRSTLYRDNYFKATVMALKAKKRASIPKGSKTKEGDIDAEYDPAEE
jgi:hypothetical protein